MTYPNATPKHNDDDKVDEASSLLTIATAAPASSMPEKKKKNGGAPMRAMIATTFFFLGTLAVIYSGRGSSTNNPTEGTLEAFLPGPNYDPYGNPGIALAPPAVYDPSGDFCFGDNANDNKYCWFPTDRFPYPAGQWGGNSDRGAGDCGPLCTKFADGLGPNPKYDRSKDFCFKDNANVGKLCWCPTHSFPVGNWGGWNAAYDNCGPQCTRGCIYDPSYDVCFTDTDNHTGIW